MPARVSVLPESPAEARVSAAHELDGREIVRQPIFTMAAEEGRVVVVDTDCCCLLNSCGRPTWRLVDRIGSLGEFCVPEPLMRPVQSMRHWERAAFVFTISPFPR